MAREARDRACLMATSKWERLLTTVSKILMGGKEQPLKKDNAIVDKQYSNETGKGQSHWRGMGCICRQ